MRTADRRTSRPPSAVFPLVFARRPYGKTFSTPEGAPVNSPGRQNSLIICHKFLSGRGFSGRQPETDLGAVVPILIPDPLGGGNSQRKPGRVALRVDLGGYPPGHPTDPCS